MSNMLHKNCLFFQLPEDLITAGTLGEMSESELKLYIALLYKAQRNTTVKPKLTGPDIPRMTGLASGSVTKARRCLIEHNLVSASRGLGNAYEYELLIPISGEPMNNYHRGGGQQHRKDGLSAIARKLFDLPREQYERYYRTRLERSEIHETANGLSACCPFHDDSSPSLDIGLEKGVWFCHACHVGGSMTKFEQRLKGCDGTTALLSVASVLGLEPLEALEEQPIAEYDYFDEGGELLFQILRFPDRDGRKQIRARRPERGFNWIWDTEGVRRVLYRLPDVLYATQVIVVEGEKDAETIRKLQLLATDGSFIAGTTNPFGAGKWQPEFSECLRGKDVLILPDNDDTGRQHAQQVQESITGIAASVKVVDIPRETDIKDVSDFMERHTDSELMELIGSDWFGTVEYVSA